jgi:hypothetical protein
MEDSNSHKIQETKELAKPKPLSKNGRIVEPTIQGKPPEGSKKEILWNEKA